MRTVCLILFGWCAFGASAQISASEIVARSVANTKADWQAAPHYDFTERDVEIKHGRGVKTYRVMMIDGSPYNKLISVNGKLLGASQAAAEEKKLREEIASRQQEKPEDRAKRVGEYQEERRQDNALLQSMVHAMNFRLSGEATVDGRRCFVLEGTPRPEYRPTSRETKVLKGMRGTMWIDQQAYQWVKVRAEVFRPVAFGLFIAQVEPGTEFTLEQKPIAGGLWLPSHFSMRVKAEVLHLWSHDTNDDETYWDYQPASPNRLVATATPR
jgi:hypothetical protein